MLDLLMEYTNKEIELIRAVRAAYTMLSEGFLTGPAAKDAARSLAAVYTKATGTLGGPERHEPSGDELIADERRRQIYAENWSPEHDDTHVRGELAREGALYALEGTVWETQVDGLCGNWESRTRKSRIRQLAIAGALIAAEIDRLQRQNRS